MVATETKLIRVRKEDYEMLVDLRQKEEALSDVISGLIADRVNQRNMSENPDMKEAETDAEADVDAQGDLGRRLDLIQKCVNQIQREERSQRDLLCRFLERIDLNSDNTEKQEASANMKKRPIYMMKEFARIAREEGMDAAEKFKDAGYQH